MSIYLKCGYKETKLQLWSLISELVILILDKITTVAVYIKQTNELLKQRHVGDINESSWIWLKRFVIFVAFLVANNFDMYYLQLARTCYNFYQSTPTKLAGENYFLHSGQVSSFSWWCVVSCVIKSFLVSAFWLCD